MWRAFELDPSAPAERDRSISHTARIAQKYRIPEAQAIASSARLTALAKAEGLDFRFDHIRSGNTFDAHRVVHMAHERGVQDAVKERFLLGYLTEGEPIGDRDTLARHAGEAGLDSEEVRAALAGDAYKQAVRDDEAEAARLEIHGVPFFVLGNRYALSGAQPTEVFLEALNRAWAELKISRRRSPRAQAAALTGAP